MNNKIRKLRYYTNTFDGEKEATTNEDKATLLNTYFCSQSTVDDSNHNLPNVPDSDCSLTSIDISIQDVKDAIHLMDASKACGPDLVSQRLIREGSDISTGPLSVYFNKSRRNY